VLVMLLANLSMSQHQSTTTIKVFIKEVGIKNRFCLSI